MKYLPYIILISCSIVVGICNKISPPLPLLSDAGYGYAIGLIVMFCYFKTKYPRNKE